jgi:RNA polymerase sigma factor (sigma-70 family)
MALEPRELYKKLNDKQLLFRMGNGDEQAFEEFYIRHRRFIYGVCRRKYATSLARKHGFNGCAEDMAQIIFIKAWRFARSFNAGGEQDAKEIKTKAQKWLCGIARTSFLEIWRKHEEFLILHLESDWDWDRHVYVNIDGDVEGQSNLLRSKAALLRKMFRLALEAIERVLSPGEQQLINVVLEYYPDDVPSWLQRELAELLKIKKSSLRQTKKRAIEKISKYVKSKLDSQDEENDGQENTDR